MKKTVFICTGLLFSAATFTTKVFATENLVFVHGAHFNAESWKQVSGSLSSNIQPVFVDLPGRMESENAEIITLSSSAKSLCREIKALEGNIHFAAHSQGGAIVNQAVGLCPSNQFQSITYITAVAPQQGETAFGSLSKQDEANYFEGVRYNETSHRMVIGDSTKFAETFAQDANEKQKDILQRLSLSEPAHIAEEKVAFEPSNMERIKKHYVFASNDKIISLESQLKIAKNAQIKSVYAMQTGHLPMLTDSEGLARILNSIVLYPSQK
ncbi:hypothetical protein CW749_25570 [Vibrio sp. vnigr-6D03]|uniref:alpha/beta hydrolase n=1 Tax=Vibrio sp. vnigr-6D03 TaxID=2058088 RepID=UPI000C3231CA|nr:alpha/beta hydrolase [Vibrio sp. vnigr-6D03]PKF76651.1 hypothetical protein CW749_25570 [Vibrio sp. vnigr-6D03]